MSHYSAGVKLGNMFLSWNRTEDEIREYVRDYKRGSEKDAEFLDGVKSVIREEAGEL